MKHTEPVVKKRFLDAIELANGDLAFVGYSENDINTLGKEIYVVRTANDGTIIWGTNHLRARQWNER